MIAYYKCSNHFNTDKGAYYFADHRDECPRCHLRAEFLWQVYPLKYPEQMQQAL